METEKYIPKETATPAELQPYPEVKEVAMTLTAADFTPETIPEDPERYKLGEPVTRENFMDILVKSFSVSRGRVGTQVRFFDYIHHDFGVDIGSI